VLSPPPLCAVFQFFREIKTPTEADVQKYHKSLTSLHHRVFCKTLVRTRLF